MLRHSLKIIATIALAITVLLGVAGTSQSATPCADVTVSIIPDSISPGGVVTVAGSVLNCSGAKERVDIQYGISGPCGVADMGTVRFLLKARETRSSSLSYTVPASACAGTYTITVSAYVGGTLLDTASATLTVQ